VLFRLLGRLAAHPIDVDGSSDVLEFFRAEILEVEIDPVDDLIVDDPRYVDRSGLGQRLEPSRDVDAVAEHIPALEDDVTEVDADAHVDAPLVRHRPVHLRGRIAYSGCATHGFDDAFELD
jgi:hypothetical protein